jgi:tricorn protease
VSVGSLGADLEQTPQGWRIARILPDFSAVGGSESPLAKAWHRVKPGQYLLAVDGRAVDPAQDPAELLVDKGAKVVRLLIADAPDGANGHLVEVTLLSSDHALRYADWVDRNRRRVAELSGGALGYMHLPDMDSEGLIAFMRAFYPQTDRQGMLVDIRDNGGGYISQVLVEKLARKPWAYTVPREGRIEPYPTRVIDGPVVVLMDQGAGSDGDIFPESMRLVNHTTLVGTTRTRVFSTAACRPSRDTASGTRSAATRSRTKAWRRMSKWSGRRRISAQAATRSWRRRSKCS